jgi:hypothetical protein
VTYLDILIDLRDIDGQEAELEIRETVGNTIKMSLVNAMKKACSMRKFTLHPYGVY